MLRHQPVRYKCQLRSKWFRGIVVKQTYGKLEMRWYTRLTPWYDSQFFWNKMTCELFFNGLIIFWKWSYVNLGNWNCYLSQQNLDLFVLLTVNMLTIKILQCLCLWKRFWLNTWMSLRLCRDLTGFNTRAQPSFVLVHTATCCTRVYGVMVWPVTSWDNGA